MERTVQSDSNTDWLALSTNLASYSNSDIVLTLERLNSATWTIRQCRR